MQDRILLTSGCSFSECITKGLESWPIQLVKHYKPKQHISKAMGSQGNGLIAKGIIYEVSQLLEAGVPNTDIVVGVMWSGYSRSEYYWDKKERGGDWSPTQNDGWMNNPTNFNDNDESGDWIIMNYQWKSCKEYYKYYYDHIGGQINTLEQVLRTQWFLEKHKIDYFMTKYMNETFELINTQPCSHLMRQIDWTKFCSREGCYEWLNRKDGGVYIDNTDHPTNEGHKLFTNEILIPFIEQNLA